MWRLFISAVDKKKECCVFNLHLLFHLILGGYVTNNFTTCSICFLQRLIYLLTFNIIWKMEYGLKFYILIYYSLTQFKFSFMSENYFLDSWMFFFLLWVIYVCVCTYIHIHNDGSQSTLSSIRGTSGNFWRHVSLSWLGGGCYWEGVFTDVYWVETGVLLSIP